MQLGDIATGTGAQAVTIKTVKVISMKDPRAINATSSAGEPLIARDAVLLGANGEIEATVIGTAKQWEWYNGETVEASFRDSKSQPGLRRWYFNPIVGSGITDPNAF